MILKTLSLRQSIYFSLICFLCFLLWSCTDRKNYTIVSDLELGESASNHPTVNSIQQSLRPLGLNLNFHNQPIQFEADIVKNINEGKVDFGIVKNDVDVHGGYNNVRTLLPLFPDVMLIICRNNPGKANIQELFANNRAGMIVDKTEEKNIIELFMRKSGASFPNLGTIHSNDSTAITEALNEFQVLILFASLNSQSVRNILNIWNGTIYSLDDPALKGLGSIVDGFCMAYPKGIPFIIPKGTYGKWPSEPTLTFAVYDVLICHKDIDSHVAYDILKSIYDMRPTLAEENFEFGMLDDNIETHKFSFPLHEGAVQYLARNQPTFWERESDLLGLIITMVVLLSGGITTLIKYLKQRRKDRVDTYYHKVLYVIQQVRNTNDVNRRSEFLNELHIIRNNAFEQLIAENLDANDAFVIFLNLVNAAIAELEQQPAVVSLPVQQA